MVGPTLVQEFLLVDTVAWARKRILLIVSGSLLMARIAYFLLQEFSANFHMIL